MSERFIEPLKRLVQGWFNERLLGFYPYVVDSFQESSQTVNASPLRSVTGKLPKIERLPIRSAKMQFLLAQGEQIVIAFEGGDRTQPFVAQLGYASEYGSALQIARKGDMVRMGGLGTLAAFYPTATPPVPPVVALGVPFLVSFGSVTSPPTPPPIQSPLYGAISTGSIRSKIA